MRRVFAVLVCALVGMGQAVPQFPPYDPNDPEGLVYHPNGWSRYAWLRKGTWTKAPLTNPFGRVPGTTAVDVQTMVATLDRLSALLQATPEGREGRGYFVKESRNWSAYDPAGLPDGTPAAKLPLRFSMGVFPFYNSDTRKNGVWVIDRGGETESAYYEFNHLPGRRAQAVIATESNAAGNPVEFYARPDTSVTFGGYPVVDGQALLISRAGHDPWSPAAYSRALKAALQRFEADKATAERRLAELTIRMDEALSPAYEQQMRVEFEQNYGSLRTKRPQGYQTRLASMVRELAYNRDRARRDANPQRDQDGNWYWHPLDAHADAIRRLADMTSQEATEPACYLDARGEQGRYQMRGAIRPMSENTTGCRPLVSDNWAYFDTSLPRTTPQLLMVTDFDRCGRLLSGPPGAVPAPTNTTPPPQGCARHAPMWRQLDWSTVAALLAP